MISAGRPASRAIRVQFRTVNLWSYTMRKLFAGLGLSVPFLANAAVPADITTAISTMSADGVTVATAFVVAAIAVAAIKFLRSAK